jgi:hypothetical protein
MQSREARVAAQAAEPTVVAAEMLERNTIRAEGREGFVQTPIAAGTFVRRGNPVTGVLQSDGVKHRRKRSGRTRREDAKGTKVAIWTLCTHLENRCMMSMSTLFSQNC